MRYRTVSFSLLRPIIKMQQSNFSDCCNSLKVLPQGQPRFIRTTFKQHSLRGTALRNTGNSTKIRTSIRRNNGHPGFRTLPAGDLARPPFCIVRPAFRRKRPIHPIRFRLLPQSLRVGAFPLLFRRAHGFTPARRPPRPRATRSNPPPSESIRYRTTQGPPRAVLQGDGKGMFLLLRLFRK